VTPSSASGVAPLTVGFTAVATAASPSWTIEEYAYSFGDGCTALVQNPSKTFAVPGDYLVRLTVSDSAGHTTQLSIPVVVAGSGVPAAPVIVAPTSPLTPGVSGERYAANFVASGTAPINWTISAGSPPPGLTLSPDGAYGGVPLVAGSSFFTVEASNAAGTDSADYVHVISSAPAYVVIAPVADSYTRNGSFAALNFGSESALAVRSSAVPDQMARAFLRFDLSSLSAPCQSATLRVLCTGLSGGALSLNAVAVADDGWGELSINWNNMPAVGATLASATVTSSGSVYELDISTYIAAEQAGDGIAGLALLDASASGPLAFFASRENVTPPELEVLCLPSPDAPFVRGDCNDDGGRNIADPIALLSHLFDGPSGFAPPCRDACDGNDDGQLDIADAIAQLTALFGSPSVPLPPPLFCGPDPSPDDGLGCAAATSCSP
jgi:PKD repeat protein